MSTAWEWAFWDCYCTVCTVEKKGGRSGGRARKRKAMEGRGGGMTLYSGSGARAPLLPLSASWRVWLRDGAARLRAIQPNSSYAPPTLLSKPPKLDYRDPTSRAYITNTCETLAGPVTVNGNAGQIKADLPVCTLSMSTDAWWKATWASVAGTAGKVGEFPPSGPL